MVLIQIVERGRGECHAGGKAPHDVCEIALRFGFKRLEVCRDVSIGLWKNRLWSIWWVIKMAFYAVKIVSGSVVLVQFPADYLRGRLGFFFLNVLRKFRRVRIIALIHDVDELRLGIGSGCVRYIIKVSDVLIVHNERMRAWFVKKGVLHKKMIALGIFDYLTNAPSPSEPDNFRTVIIAGNLDVMKTGYLSGLKNIVDVHWLLYGPSYDGSRCGGPNVFYVGCYNADELPGKLSGGFGLVWDGESVDTCAGRYGEYLRYNNPHKLSLYLASGIPVIIWSEAAEAKLVVREKVGLVVGSLREIGGVLRGVNSVDYLAMRHRARKFGRRLRAGEFLSSALKSAVD